MVFQQPHGERSSPPGNSKKAPGSAIQDANSVQWPIPGLRMSLSCNPRQQQCLHCSCAEVPATKTHMTTTNCSRCTTNLARRMLSVLRFAALLIHAKHVHAASWHRQSLPRPPAARCTTSCRRRGTACCDLLPSATDRGAEADCWTPRATLLPRICFCSAAHYEGGESRHPPCNCRVSFTYGTCGTCGSLVSRLKEEELYSYFGA